MGLSLLVEPGTETLRVTARWGDYRREDSAEEEGADGGRKTPPQWRRMRRAVMIDVPMQGRAPIPTGWRSPARSARRRGG